MVETAYLASAAYICPQGWTYGAPQEMVNSPADNKPQGNQHGNNIDGLFDTWQTMVHKLSPPTEHVIHAGITGAISTSIHLNKSEQQ